MRIFTILCLLLVTTCLQAQQAQTTPKQPTAGQVLSNHFARTYQAALRYNDYNVAKNALYNMLVQNPQNDSILYSLSLIYFQSNQYASAALTAQDVMNMNPNNVGALEIAAISYYNLGVQDKALEAYESLYLKTDDFQTLYKMAILQYEMQSYTESKTNADILIGKKEAEESTISISDEQGNAKEYPIKAALFNLKGLIAQAQNDKKAAEGFFQQALSIAPDFELAKTNLAELKK